MNKEKLLQVADAIEASELLHFGFNMKVFKDSTAIGILDNSGRGCGTVGCIAGWTIATFQADHWKSGDPDIFAFRAQEELNLTDRQAHDLFFVGPAQENPYHPGWDATPAQAAMVIRHLAKTGEVDWDLPFEGESK